MSKHRIGVAINAQHRHVEDQELYQGVRAYGQEHPEFEYVLAPFAAEDLKVAKPGRSPYDGILAQATPELVDLAIQANVPVVDVWRDSRVTKPINCVFPDFELAGRMVAQHLTQRGFERFGYVINRGVQSQALMCDGRLINWESRGFAAYLKSKGHKVTRHLAPKSVDSNAAIWRRWSKSIRSWLIKQAKPIGLFVPNDWMCRYIADVCLEQGYRMPHDVGLICADNEQNLCLLTNPSLTAIDLNYRRVGYEAAAMVQRLLHEEQPMGEREIIELEPRAIYPRTSTDVSHSRDPMVATAMRFILDNVHRDISVTDVASHVSSTRRTLERRFRDILDSTVMKEITRCRLDRLKRRLVESDDPIKSLVHDSGFNSVRVLYETFVREEGMSPSAYRAKRWVEGHPGQPEEDL